MTALYAEKRTKARHDSLRAAPKRSARCLVMLVGRSEATVEPQELVPYKRTYRRGSQHHHDGRDQEYGSLKISGAEGR